MHTHVHVSVTVPRCLRSKARQTVKRKGDEEEEDDITANPWDGRYGPEPPEESLDHQPHGFGLGVHSVQGVVQWDDGGGGSNDVGGSGTGPKKIKTTVLGSSGS